ncbi:hypothetical protein MKW92_050247 [Papaver armeniacum]|nr:hypothetical protein MKW92_050247 [Papaver armeniacum]
MKLHHCFLLTQQTFPFLLSSFIIFGSIVTIYIWLAFSPYQRHDIPLLGCRRDNEGSWSIGVFYGESPFSLKPIEHANVWKNETSAWPVANPVLTCASATNAGYPSNFVADPFIYIQDDILYMFYESKNSITFQGDIAVAKSMDKGATWQQLGTALDEDCHLSYPYVFDYQGHIYMMPESNKKGELRLYRALDFPLQWTLHKVIMNKPFIDAFLINYNGNYWLFGSDHSGYGTKKNGQLEIWYSNSPMGPWQPHNQNPIYNTDRSYGARNGGRPFVYEGNLYRLGQDCGETYGRRLRSFKVEVLTKNEYREVEVPLGIEESGKGRNAWNGARYHSLDVQQLTTGEWVGVMDGDRVPSGDVGHRLLIGSMDFAVASALVILVGLMVGAINCVLPICWSSQSFGKRSDTISSWVRPDSWLFKLRRISTRLNRMVSFARCRMKGDSCYGRLLFILVFVTAVALVCYGVNYTYGGSGAEEAYPLEGHFSQFTLLTMTYDARLWNLKMYVKHYSKCSSVREIVIVWNKGQPPNISELNSAVPVRIRVEKQNSLNNRFKIDPLIMTKSVLELDDDIMMTCDDIERGFLAWRQHPDRIVGFYPRLIDGSPLEYRDGKYARKHHGYNMILTGAAFIDHRVAFERYWSEEAKEGRDFVDKYFNCEDLLLNFLYANASSSSRAVEYVKPAWAIDTSKFSSAAISRNTQVHYQFRTNCLLEFSQMYGSLGRKWAFKGRKDGWDV